MNNLLNTLIIQNSKVVVNYTKGLAIGTINSVIAKSNKYLNTRISLIQQDKSDNIYHEEATKRGKLDGTSSLMTMMLVIMMYLFFGKIIGTLYAAWVTGVYLYSAVEICFIMTRELVSFYKRACYAS